MQAVTAESQPQVLTVSPSNTAGAMATGRYKSSTTTAETEVSFEDVPQKPEVLRMTLKTKSLWERIMENAKHLTPEKLMELISREKDRIMAKVSERGYITEDEAEVLNRSTEQHLEKILEDFKARAMEQLKVQPSDKPEVIKAKVGIADMLLQWLSDLFAWVLNKIKEIFRKIKESIEWCWKKAKELFQYLYSLFT